MPEGHTLYRLAREQSQLFAGRPVHVSSPQGRFEAGAALLDGRVLDEVFSYGKHLFAGFGGDTLHVHLGLYGSYTTGTGAPPPARGALRMRWEGPGSGRATASGPTCAARPPARCCPPRRSTGSWRGSARTRCGPAPTAVRPTGASPAAARRSARCSWTRRCSPASATSTARNCCSGTASRRSGRGAGVEPDLWSRMWADLVALMRSGVRMGRIVTTRPEDRTRRSGAVQRDDAHYVYRRTGLPCRVCGTEVRTEVMVGRNLYWCPVCQAA